MKKETSCEVEALLKSETIQAALAALELWKRGVLVASPASAHLFEADANFKSDK